MALRFLLFLLFAAVAGLLGWQYYQSRNPRTLVYVLDKVERWEKLTEIVGVTGTSEPLQVVVVESELPGVVAQVHKDFNDTVSENEVLAELRDDQEQMKLEQANQLVETAKLAPKSAKSQQQVALLGVKAAQQLQELAESSVRRLNQADSAIAPAEKEKAENGLKLAMTQLEKARVESDQALLGLDQAKNNVANAELTVRSAKLALSMTKLKSPIAGFVLSKNIRVGDLVGRPRLSLSTGPNASNSSALFEIATTLEKMRAVVKIAEGDYGQVKVGQATEFEVDAYPGEKFRGKVTKIRNAATMDRTTVAYPAEVEFDNRRDPKSNEWMVRPGSTVTMDIVIREVRDVLVVPGAAMLYNPSIETKKPSIGEGEALVWTVGPAPERLPQPVKIKTGISSGKYTQVLEGDLAPGQEIIISEPPKRPAFRLPSLGG